MENIHSSAKNRKYTATRELWRRDEVQRQDFQNSMLPAFNSHLASNFIHTSDFPAKPYYFPSSCYNCFLCHFTHFGDSLICAIYFHDGNMECFPRLCFHWQASFFPLGSFLCFPAVSHACSSAQDQEYRHSSLMRAASICFCDTQASSKQLHLTNPATVFQDEELTIWLVREDSSTNTALRSLSTAAGLQQPLTESADNSHDQAD